MHEDYFSVPLVFPYFFILGERPALCLSHEYSFFHFIADQSNLNSPHIWKYYSGFINVIFRNQIYPTQRGN